VTLDISIEDIRGVYPSGTSDVELDRTLESALAWVKYYAPCTESLSFPSSSNAIVRDLVIRALRFDRDAASGAVQSRSTGPFAITVDNRQKSNGELFNENQIATLRGLCRTSAEDSYINGMVSVQLGAPRPRFRS